MSAHPANWAAILQSRDSIGIEYASRHGTKTGNAIGRPKRIFDRTEDVRLRASGLSIEKISSQLRLGVGTVVRVLRADPGKLAFQNPSS
jgi:hypothetical protein